jgi:hypothetical protein
MMGKTFLLVVFSMFVSSSWAAAQTRNTKSFQSAERDVPNHYRPGTHSPGAREGVRGIVLGANMEDEAAYGEVLLS